MKLFLMIRTGLRRCVPLSWRQVLAQCRRRARDERFSFIFVSRGDVSSSVEPLLEKRIALVQPIVRGQMYENKLHNLKRGASLVNGLVLQPGQAFSFWHSIGRASRANGFLEGRNIVQGRLQRELGGGLCQLSSLLYHLALLGGLQITERHPHSLDLYREEDRFAPLGADATVVWGVKDLRWRNPHDFTTRLTCWVEDGVLKASLHGVMSWSPKEVDFASYPLAATSEGKSVRVATLVDGQLLSQNDYLQKPGMQLS